MEEIQPDLQPVLKGTLITLRPLQTADFDELYKCASNPKIWEQHPQPDRFKKEVFQKYFDGAMTSKGALAVIESMNGSIIGSSRYYNLDLTKRQITVGYTFLRTEYWGGKFNRELKSLMLRHIFQFVDSVIFEIGAKNLRSRKAIEKIGAQLATTETLDQQPHVIYHIDIKQLEASAFSAVEQLCR